MTFQPMLTCRDRPDLDKLRYPILLSPKLDGIRALIVDGQVRSRSMKLIPNRYVQELFGQSGLDGLDGELVVGSPTDKNCMQNTTSGVMSIEGEPEVTYYIFDDWGELKLPYATRLLKLDKMDQVGLDIKIVPHHLCHNRTEIEYWEEHYVSAGYEGVMLHNPNSAYKFGRTTMKEAISFKLKRWEDDEAVIIEVRELEHNDNEKVQDAFGRAKRSSAKAGKRAGGTMGELACCLLADVDKYAPGHLPTFNIGTGFSAQQRAWFWAHRDAVQGSVVKFKHFAITGVVDKPRNPVYLGVRSKLDI